MKLPRKTIAARITLTAIALGTVAAIGVMTTQATFTDQVTMAQVTVQGGTLDLKAAGGDGPNQAWTTGFSAAVSNMKPGDESSGTVLVKNNGTVPFTATVTASGADTNSCYSYYFRETSAPAGATKAASWPVNLTNGGTAAGADGTTQAFASGMSAVTLPDNGVDTTWDTDDEKVYTLTVRMKSACTTNGANGTLDFTLNATQA